VKVVVCPPVVLIATVLGDAEPGPLTVSVAVPAMEFWRTFPLESTDWALRSMTEVPSGASRVLCADDGSMLMVN
jgi:hypothetical protein